ncbi:MAG: hypothetical protein GY699_04970, partial [Desulfobacteraceae bacterium]|nr:hypothetical protein [Desulfobacteraceae bacterium]
MRNITMEKIAVTLLLITFILLPYPVASSPALINFQGVLKDATNQPITNTLPITFEIFIHETDGIPGGGIWQETHPGVSIIEGIYSVLLGSVNAGTLTPDLFSSDELWLEVTVDSEIMSPRQRITSVAYALNAGSIDGLDSTSFLSSTSGTMTGDLTVQGTLMAGGDKGLFINGTGKVGIGTSEPATQLDVEGGDIRTDGGMKFSYGSESCDNQIYTSSYGFDFLNFQSSDIRFATSETDCAALTRMVIKDDGKVGIGTREPATQLDVEGGDIRTDGGMKFSYGSESCDNLIYTSTNGFDFLNFQ